MIFFIYSALECARTNGLEFFAYCKKCKMHFCPFCIGNHLKISQNKHDIVFLGNITPSQEDISEAKINLSERVTLTNKIIEKIEKAKNRFCFIANNLKLLSPIVMFRLLLSDIRTFI